MSMGDLYEEMKAVLKFLGLNFSEMYKVDMVLGDGKISFTYGGRTVTVDQSDGDIG